MFTPNQTNFLFFLVICLYSCAGQRNTYNFDFGWKFKLGNVANEDLCPSNAFTIDLTDKYCPNWAHQAAYGITEEECRLYCCGEVTCAGYNYNNGFCTVGNSIADCVSSQGYSGAGRTVPATIPQPPQNGPQSSQYDDSTWDDVVVPHDYVVLQTPDISEEGSHGYRARNISWYRKHFTLDNTFQNQVIYLEFDGVYRSSDMWLNGRFLGHHASGYTSFRYRLDNFPGINLNGANLLSVRIDPRSNEGWWYEGAGIYRHVNIVRTNLFHISPWGIYVPTSVTGNIGTGPNQLLVADSQVEIYVNVTNFKNVASTASVTVQILSPDNSVVYKSEIGSVNLNPQQTNTLYAKTVLTGATLWDPSQPALYTLTATLNENSGGTDSVSTTFGFRKLKFDPNLGFFLNDRNTKVRGVCNHQDFAGVGSAVPDRVNKFRVEKLQSFGVNAWRMSHNPPNPELLDFTDQLGMLVWDENRFFGEFSQWYTDLQDMLLRDRNHPSIIWWSLCNEWGCQQSDMNSTISAGKKFRNLLKSLDVTRPISGAWNGDLNSGIQWAENVCDIMGINYNYGSYDPFHQQVPTIPVISSESCSCTSDRSIYINHSEAIIGPFNAWSCVRDCWQPVATRDFVMGSFDWTGFDYRGEETPTGWPAINSHFGGIDLSGFEKDAMEYFQAWFFPDNPVVHIVPQDISFLKTEQLMAIPCGQASKWKFGNSATTASVIESVMSPGNCIQGGPNYPALVVPCQPTNPLFNFFTDGYGQVFYRDSTGAKKCLDIYGGTGPYVGFYQCKNEPNTNQDWTYSNGVFQSVSLNGNCVGNGGQVYVYTNGDSVELFSDGKSLGVQTLQPYDSGIFLVQGISNFNSVSAVVKKNGALWGNETVTKSTNGKVIVLEVERPTNSGPIFSDGQDVALLRVSIVDQSGNLVRTATDVLMFSVTSGDGRIVGTGNGNPSDHTPDQGNKRAVWNGFARVVVGANKSTTNGKITVVATGSGLQSAQVTIDTVPRNNVQYL